MALIPCICVSTLYVLLSMLLAEALRKSAVALMPDSLARTAVMEFIAAAEMCACGFELIISKTTGTINIHLKIKNVNFLRNFGPILFST